MIDKELETLRDAVLAPVRLGKRRHAHGVLADKGGIAAPRLQEVLRELVKQPRVSARRTALDAKLHTLGIQERQAIGAVVPVVGAEAGIFVW